MAVGSKQAASLPWSANGSLLRSSWSELSQAPRGGPRYALELFLTSLPLVLVDAGALWSVLEVWSRVFAGLGIEPLGLSRRVLSPLVSILPLLFLLSGLYPGTALGRAVEIRLTTKATSLLFGMHTALVLPMVGGDGTSLSFMLAAWMSALVALPAARTVGRSLLATTRWWGQRTLVLGFNSESKSTFRQLQAHREWGLRPVAFLNAADLIVPGRADLAERSLALAARVAQRERVFWTVVVLERGMEPLLEARELLYVPNVLVVSKTLAARPLAPGQPFLGAGLTGVQERNGLLNPVLQAQKRVLDVLIALLAAVPAAPLMLVIALLVWLTSRGPVLYPHKRIGRGGRHIDVYKFRTMVLDAAPKLEAYLDANPEMRVEWEQTQKLQRDPRVTWVGRWLRRFSLDELPQLVNVLYGEMSIVGPRPIVDNEVEKYGGAFELYKRVRPGITGLWQVSGRNDTSYEQRVDLDTYYVRNWSIWLELDILMSTVSVVFGGKGAF